MFSITGYFGVNIVLNLVKIYGALIAVTGKLCHWATILDSNLFSMSLIYITWFWLSEIVCWQAKFHFLSDNTFQKWTRIFMGKHQSVLAVYQSFIRCIITGSLNAILCRCWLTCTWNAVFVERCWLILLLCFLFSVTTSRKALTIILSFILFAKPFTFQ